MLGSAKKPLGRPKYCSIVVLAAVVALVPPSASPPPLAHRAARPPFDAWLAALIDEAVDAGFERRLVDDTLAGLQPLTRVIEADRSQAEVASSLDEYLNARLTAELIVQGRDMMRQHAGVLGRIERQFGVQPRFVVAIWGAETGYGRYTGDVPVFQALATLAWEPRRAAYFRSEMFDALRIVQRGDADSHAMVGSWAGAIGQPQFMPSSYLDYAVDFDEDGRRDIWRSVADTLASIANYLQEFGWRSGETWGGEVAIATAVRPRVDAAVTTRQTGCGAIRTLTERRPLADWAALGVRRLDGSRLPPADVEASLVTLDRRMFLIHRNYEAILGYNCAHRYALSVSMLADQLR